MDKRRPVEIVSEEFEATTGFQLLFNEPDRYGNHNLRLTDAAVLDRNTKITPQQIEVLCHNLSQKLGLQGSDLWLTIPPTALSGTEEQLTYLGVFDRQRHILMVMHELWSVIAHLHKIEIIRD